MWLRFVGTMLVCVSLQHAAQAQQVDCDRIRTTTVPYQIKLELEMVSTLPNVQPTVRNVIHQIYRSPSGGETVSYSKVNDFPVVKTTTYGPYTLEISSGGRSNKVSYKGLDPQNMLSVTTQTFEMTHTTTGAEPLTLTIDRSVKERRTVVLSNCQFEVIRYVSKTVDKDGKLGFIFSEIEYMPQIQAVYSSKTENVKTIARATLVAREISLDFKPVE